MNHKKRCQHTHTKRTKCPHFESQPRFVKTAYYYAQRYRTVRMQAFQQRYLLALMLKEKGNRLFKMGTMV